MQNNCHQNERTLKQHFANIVQKHQRLVEQTKPKKSMVQIRRILRWVLYKQYELEKNKLKTSRCVKCDEAGSQGKIKNTSV